MRLPLRHTLATLAYRAAKALRDAPPGFGAFRPSPGSRSAVEILAHMGDLCDWGTTLVRDREKWNESPPLSWDDEVARFFGCLEAFDRELASDAPLGSPEAIFQGPIADALTHVGQLTLMRRMAASPVRGESYFRADIVAGRVGPDQSTPRREFD